VIPFDARIDAAAMAAMGVVRAELDGADPLSPSDLKRVFRHELTEMQRNHWRNWVWTALQAGWPETFDDYQTRH
tara:strand:- start:4157 stop:4378 length:222 start_codon:yes stop_codon:yes gene_type:complete